MTATSILGFDDFVSRVLGSDNAKLAKNSAEKFRLLYRCYEASCESNSDPDKVWAELQQYDPWCTQFKAMRPEPAPAVVVSDWMQWAGINRF